MAQIIDLPPPGQGARLAYRGWNVWMGWLDLGLGPERVLAHEVAPGQGVLVRTLKIYGDAGAFLAQVRGRAGAETINMMPFTQGQLKDHFSVDFHPTIIQNDEQFRVPDGAGGLRDMNSDEICATMNKVDFEWQKLSDDGTDTFPILSAKNPDDPP